MSCTSCGRTNRAGARFCGGCGAALAPRCPVCGAENEPDAQFCDACGAPLATPAGEAAAARKIVTIVFADLIGSTALHERLDPESVARLMDRYHRAVRAPVEAHGGALVQLLGDGVMCAFGVPRVAEDDAIRAVRAAVEVQRSFREFALAERALAGELGLRVAINTGEVVVSDEHAAGIGDPLNVAARLQQEARDGDVLIGEETQRLVRELVTLEPVGRFALKGRAGTVAAFRVVSLERPAGAAAVAFVGREDELRRLTSVYDAAVSAPAARLAVVLGSPGLGKSRLLSELARRLGDRATLLSAQCNAAGGATFAPLAEALRAHFGLETGAGGEALRAAIDAVVPGEEAERARIAAGIGALLAGTPATPEETFFVVRRLLAALASARPVVLAIDDLQWAEPLLLDLTEHLVQWGAGVPLLVLAAARPELRTTRSALTSAGGVVADVVTLAGLDAAAATRLAANVIGADVLPAAVAGRVLAQSEGNPLFLGELVRMLVNDGALKREGERWTAAAELAHLEMPPTIQALLAARIERLGPEERLVLERAAVVGRQFSRSAVAHLLPREAQADLDARLESLRRSELIEPDPGWLLAEPALRFHHVLIRDAAYRRLLRNTRAELHARFAEWLEARAGESVEHDETIGWHLEQAHEHLRGLGPLDADGRALGARAARYLAAAGRRALARDDVLPAASLLGRALDRLAAADSARVELALDWCEALLSAGDVAHAAHALAELAGSMADSDRLRAWHTCFSGQLAVLTDPKALHASADAVAAAAATLAAAGDAAGEAKAHSVHADALSRLGQVGASEAALDRALAAARRVNDRRRANAVLAGAPLAALWGPSPVTRASGRCLDVVRVLRITQGAPAVEAVALRCQGVLEALRGRTDAARRMIASSRRMVEELGLTQGLFETEMSAGLVELIQGDDAAAERSLRAAYEGFRDHGLGIDAARAAGLLGRTLLPQGRAAEAEALSHESEALAGDDLQAAITWRRVRAEALALRGEHASAVELARAAVGIAAATDALLHHADARLALATALRAAGRSDEAAAEEARAIGLWEAKGATLPAERARRGDATRPAAARPGAASDAPPRAIRGRIERNQATVHLARIDEAVAARDLQAVEWLLCDAQALDHTSGRWMIELSAELAFGHEVIAALGPSLALARWRESGSNLVDADLPIGPFELDGMVLIEADAEARARRVEVFAAGKLGEAVARLYERYAELLPEGPERTRAAATARSVAALPGRPERWPFAADVEATDHRTVGWGSLHGADAVLRSIRTLIELSGDFANRLEDVLALRSDALLVSWTTSGTVRASGGAFERSLCQLFVFAADGRLARWEQFDAEQSAEALARFDALAEEPPCPIRRRVRANAATANLARLDAAIAARDAGALPALFAHEIRTVTQQLPGGVLDRQGVLATWRSLLSAEAPTCRHQPLATLGDSLVLCRQSVSASGFVGRMFDVAAYGREMFALVEVDSDGRQRRAEFLATGRLGDAVVRLYERYAELLPDGPERVRAEATARSVACYSGPHDLERLAAVCADDVEFVDRRQIGLGSAQGAPAFLQLVESLIEAAPDSTNRIDDVLGVRPDALLIRITNSGTDRTTGGTFERCILRLAIFGADGLTTRLEQFDAEGDAEALARFDELAVEEPPARPVRRRVRPNAATANAARVDTAIAARDFDAFPTLWADESVTVGHETRTTWDRQGSLAAWRSMLRVRDAKSRHEPLATLGDSLALCRWSTSGSGFAGRNFDVGAYEREEVTLVEVDAQRRRRRTEAFPVEQLGDAVARLYERYAELLSEGPERDRAAATARSVAASPVLQIPWFVSGPTAFAPGVEFVDHRTVGLGSGHGAEELLRRIRALRELTENWAARVDDVLGLRSDALLVRWTNSGTERAGGGTYERHLLQLLTFGADGRVEHWEQFDAEQDAEALARFDELTAGPPPARPVHRRVRPNAATANSARLEAAVAARALDAIAAVFSESMETVNHPAGATYGRDAVLTTLRGALASSREFAWREEPLATLGESLALLRASLTAAGFTGDRFDVGAFEREDIYLNEVDAHGRRLRSEIFAADHLGDAIVRLYERYAESVPEGPERTQIAATARAFASQLGPLDVDRFLSAMAPDVDYFDHRMLVGVGSAHGVQEFRALLRTLFEVAADLANRVDDVLAARSDALLLRVTNRGTERAGAGSFERPFLSLSIFGAEGLIRRAEQFDVGHEAEAFARFDELAAEAPPPRPVRRRVRPNAATGQAARFDAALAERDAAALPLLLAEETEVIDHTSGITYGRSGELDHYRRQLRAQSLVHRQEPLATLGDSLALCRQSVSASGAAGSTFDVGAFEFDIITLVEVDARGRRRRIEAFAVDHLGDAIARLYERHAELLPAGPERTRATATARTVAVLVSRELVSEDRYDGTFAPDVEFVDHRALVGLPPARGVDEIRQRIQRWFETVEGSAYSIDDVLGLRADGLLVRQSERGRDRIGGGSFEGQHLMLWIFAADGLQARSEMFDPDRVAEALARFDELAGGPPAPPVARRRVRPNAATAHAARLDAAIAARDAEALPALFADEEAGVDHPTHTAWDRQAFLFSWGSLLRAQDPTCRHEPLATLGDSLVLCRLSVSASGLARGSLDVGAYENTEFLLIEVDAQGRRCWAEAFATERLGDAMVRLYQRQAELLPEGPERTRAALIADSVVLFGGITRPDGPDRLAAAIAPDVEFVDRRRLGLPPSRGPEALVRMVRSLHEVAYDLSGRVDEILELGAEAQLIRWTNFGTDRAGGGAFERQFLVLRVFGSEGLLSHYEFFDPDRVAEALARFDELAAGPPAPPVARRRVRPNAATVHAARLDTAIAARDADALPSLFSDAMEAMDHINHTAWDRQAVCSSWRSLALAEDPTCRHEPLATLGDSLALCRMSLSASRLARGSFDVGGYEKTEIHLIEVDAHGRRCWTETFAVEKLGDAVARLYERYAELFPEGPERTHTTANARFAALVGPFEPDRWATALAPAIEVVDHRTLGTWSVQGAEELLQNLRAWLDLAEGITNRAEEIIALRSDALLARWTHLGTDRASGGAYERPFLMYWAVDGEGLVSRWELFDPDRIDEALARFDELAAAAAAAPAARFANAATRGVNELIRRLATRDWEGSVARFATTMRLIDRRRLTALDLESSDFLANLRFIYDLPGVRWNREVLATRGERLALDRWRLESDDGTGGVADVEYLAIAEVDSAGRQILSVIFEPDDLDGAHAELDTRYAAGEAAPYSGTWATLQRFGRAVAARDWEQLASAFAPDFVVEDHRPPGLLSSLSRDDWVASFRALTDLRPDAALQTEHVLALDDRRFLAVRRWVGVESEGAFEIPIVLAAECGAGGLRRLHLYDLDQLDAARARLAAIDASAPRDPLAALFRPNAATAALDRLQAAFEARDWAAVRALAAEGARYEDRCRHAQTSGDIEMWVASLKLAVEATESDLHCERSLVSTAGERVCLERLLWSGGPAEGRVEIEYLRVAEVDEAGRFVAFVMFDVDDRRAASREAMARWLARDAAAAVVMGPLLEVIEAWNDHDRARMRALFADDLAVDDRRLAGQGRIEGADAYLDGLAVLWDLAAVIQYEPRFVLALEHHGAVAVSGTFGTLPEGGDFEICGIVLATVERGLVTRIEMFELEAVDAALARFAELRATGHP